MLLMGKHDEKGRKLSHALPVISKLNGAFKNSSPYMFSMDILFSTGMATSLASFSFPAFKWRFPGLAGYTGVFPLDRFNRPTGEAGTPAAGDVRLNRRVSVSRDGALAVSSSAAHIPPSVFLARRGQV